MKKLQLKINKKVWMSVVGIVLAALSPFIFFLTILSIDYAKCGVDLKLYPQTRVSTKVAFIKTSLDQHMDAEMLDNRSFGPDCTTNSEIGTSIQKLRSSYVYGTQKNQQELASSIESALASDGWERNNVGANRNNIDYIFFNKKIGQDDFSLKFVWDGFLNEHAFCLYPEDRRNNFTKVPLLDKKNYTNAFCIQIDHK